MSCESKSWRPAHWSYTKRRLFEDHVYQWLELEVNEFLGCHEGRKLAALVRAQRRAKQSLAALHERGWCTLGDV